MIKRPFLTFILVVGSLVLGAMWFIQSQTFAKILKTIASRYVPKDLGVNADFSEISIKFYPPGFSVRNPRVSLAERNIVGLPPGSKVEAKSIDFTFVPLQALSGSIRIHEVTIVDSKIELILDQGAASDSKKNVPTNTLAKVELHWDELLNVRAESVGLINSDILLKFKNSEDTLEVHANNFRLSQWSGRGGLGYSADAELENVRGSLLKSIGIPVAIDHLRAVAYVNALGLQVDTLSLKNDGFILGAQGEVTGNLLDRKALKAQLNVKVDGDLSKLILMTGLLPAKEAPSGSVSFTGTIQANLEKWLQTLKAEGSLNVQSLKFKKWAADQVQLAAKWENGPGGGVVSLVKGLIQTEQRPRIGGKQAGDGGKIEIGPVKYALGVTRSVTVPLIFQGAHIHWLGAAALRDVYPLDFRINGPINLTVNTQSGSQPWEIKAELASSIENFVLDNQRLGQVKPLKKVFNVPKIKLAGQIRVDPTGLYPSGVQLSMPNSKLIVKGKLDFKKGYDLFAEGPLDLADLGQIADNESRGSGPVQVSVRGPSSRVLVEVDVALKDTYYLNLFLGDTKGRIIWDDDPQNLIFEKVKGTRNATLYAADGVLKLGKDDSADLNFRIPQGNIQDFIQIFQHLTHPIWWFPETLSGPFSGALRVSGGLSLHQLEVNGQISGTNWEWKGERFKAVYLSGGYTRGAYSVDECRILKRSSRINGGISYGSDGHLDWKVDTRELQLADLDMVSRLDVPLRGRMKIKSAGQGFLGALKSSTSIELEDFSVRGTQMPSSFASFDIIGGVAKLSAAVMGGEGTVDAVYNFNAREKSRIQLQLKQFDFSPVLLLLNSQSVQDRSLLGQISAQVDLNFNAGKAERANGRIEISEYALERKDAAFGLDRPVSADIVDGSFVLDNIVIKGNQGELSASLTSHKGDISGSVGGDVDLSIVQFFVSSVSQASGLARLNLNIGGSLKDPEISGRANINGGSVRLYSLESPFENITGTLTLRKNIFGVQKVESDVGGGKIVTDGRVVLYADRYPALFLESRLLNPKIKIFPFQYAKVNGNLEIHGESPPYLVEGQVQIDSAVSKEKVFARRQTGQGLKAMPYSPPPTRQSETSFSKFNLNLDVNAQKGVFLQNDLFRDVELKAGLKVINTLDAPRISGKVEVIGGKLLFKDHIFQIQNAAANFDRPTAIDPLLDLNASTEINNIKISMFASGRQDKLKVELSSNPPMQEAEILSLLTVGLTPSDVKKLNTTDLSAVQYGEGASLVLHSLDFNRDLEEKTGFQLKVDESINPQQGVSAFRPQGDSAGAPQITIRRKLGDRLSLSVGSTIGVGTSSSRQFILDYSVNRDVSVTGVYNNYGAYGTLDNQTYLPSFGVDLKIQKRFK
ncbi:MAG: translocation/assembly module TamB domain-containing protein [Bdellovibrio sp.]|nr:translocation/assembly module TamB domain-containing protein [Bdellovibrio sp.]